MPSRGRNRIAAVALTATLLLAASCGVARAAAQGPHLTAGGGHTCAILAAGYVECWGDNGSGQLGDGTTIDRTAAARVRGIAHAVAIAAGDAHSCAVIANEHVKCWGNDYAGQLGDGARRNRSRPVAVRGIARAVGIAAGDGFSCALLSNGKVKCWGGGADGQLGDGSERTRTTPVLVRRLTGVVQVSAAGNHACALVSGGSIECWGSDPYGQLGDIANRPIPISGIAGATAVAAGGGAIPDKIAENDSEYSCAIVDFGQVWCWGDNRAGQLGDGTTTTSATPVRVSGVEGATQLTAGVQHACALVSAGAIECWGDDRAGELGAGSISDHSTAVPVVGLSGATGVSAGGNFGSAHTCALLPRFAVECWGNNRFGQLGDGTTTRRSRPTRVLRRRR
jgi:alpha-tubulin suppressor-like RCC1 family protein